MPLPREVLPGHRRHVLPQLVAKREQPAPPERAANRQQLVCGLVPEIQDMTGDDNIEGRYLGAAGRRGRKAPVVTDRGRSVVSACA